MSGPICKQCNEQTCGCVRDEIVIGRTPVGEYQIIRIWLPEADLPEPPEVE